MPITISFTLTALIALCINSWFMLRVINKRLDLKASGLNGHLKLIANTFLAMWAIILLSDLLIFVAGMGILSGYRELGFLLAFVPIASTSMGLLALRGLLGD